MLHQFSLCDVAKFYNDVVLQFVGVKFGQILSVLSLTLFQTLVELAAAVVHYSFSCVLTSRSPTSHPSIVVGLKCPQEERYTGADGFGFSIKGFKNLQFFNRIFQICEMEHG
ncbi:hypothetical protein QL285_081079 [Trifolium repens]|nr:hypothetical protein QL285_081079 [Trifolium repens]